MQCAADCRNEGRARCCEWRARRWAINRCKPRRMLRCWSGWRRWARSIRASATGASRIFLGREGHGMSWGRCYRLWRCARLQVPRRRPRKRIASGRPRPQAPTGANQVWSYDFVFDWCANGQQLKCLTVTDEWTREGLAIEVDGRIRSGRVIEVLSRLISERGAPLYLRSDNGPEFVARALLKWMADQGIETALIDPGKPWQNGVAESFNGKFRDECLSLEWFLLARPGQGRHRSLAPPLQRGAPSFEPRLFDARRVRRKTERRSTRFRNGPGRCAIWGLRAPARCISVLRGTFKRQGDAGSLKLTVVRRIRAGRQAGMSKDSPAIMLARCLSAFLTEVPFCSLPPTPTLLSLLGGCSVGSYFLPVKYPAVSTRSIFSQVISQTRNSSENNPRLFEAG